MKHYWKLVGLCGVLFSIWGNGALAQGKEKLVLRVADSLPTSGHWMVENATKFWMEAVTRATGGTVTFEYYPSEQLGKVRDMLALTQSGVVDIAYVAPSHLSDNKMSLSSVAELPGSFTTSCQGTLAYWRLATKNGILAENDFAPNGVRPLWSAVMPPYQITIAKKKVQSLKDVEGLKLRAVGGALEITTRKLKAVPVRVPSPEIYDSISRGTVDGVILAISSLGSYNLHRLIKYATVDESLGSFVANYVISEARWKKLPESVQKAMINAGEEATRRVCAALDRDLQTDIAKFKQQGMVPIHFSAVDKKELQTRMASVQSEWAEEMDKRGKPGSEVLKAFQDALKAGR